MLYFLLNWRIQTNLVQIVFKPSLVLKHDFMGVPLCPTYVSAWLPKIPEEIHPTNFTKNHVRENRVTFGGAKKTLSILVESNYEIDEEFDDSSNWSLIYMRKIHGSKSWKYIASPAKLVSTKNDEPSLQTLKWGLIKNTSSEVFPDFRHCRLLVFSGLYFLLRKKNTSPEEVIASGYLMFPRHLGTSWAVRPGVMGKITWPKSWSRVAIRGMVVQAYDRKSLS